MCFNPSVVFREDDHVGDENDYAGAEDGDDDGENYVELAVLLIIII